jgi:ADP-heptose:LPS heptosyltransferase
MKYHLEMFDGSHNGNGSSNGNGSAAAGLDGAPPRTIAFDCRFFLGDRPCLWHKQEQAVCVCGHYEPLRERVLIIKLDAIGDVLRTTTLLPPLRKAHPYAAISWLTRAEAAPLLENNPYLSQVIIYGPDAFTHLGARRFDRVINLDAGRISAGLAALAQSSRKDGFVLDPEGYVVSTNRAAKHCLEMGVFDDLKKNNQRTYQSLMAAILDVSDRETQYVLELREQELAAVRSHLTDLGVDLDSPVVGLNTGAGERWQFKQWRLDGFVELTRRIHDEMGAQVVLLGGPSERDRHAFLMKNSDRPVFDTGNDNSLRHFAALIAHCAVVVSGDTLAMHIALAAGRRVVALFGPTSAAEIELYGLGEKIVPDLDCLVCYKERCGLSPNCMDLISVDMVAAAVARQLGAGVPATPPWQSNIELPLACTQSAN